MWYLHYDLPSPPILCIVKDMRSASYNNECTWLNLEAFYKGHLRIHFLITYLVVCMKTKGSRNDRKKGDERYYVLTQ